MGTADSLKRLIELAEHNHDLLHLLLRLQGLEKIQIDKLVAARADAAEWERLIGQLKIPTAELKTAVEEHE